MADKRDMLYEGKAKRVYATDSAGYYIIEYKDDATAFNGQKKGTIVGKGIVNNQMANFLFGLLANAGIPTHFVKQLSDRETLVFAVKIVPLEVVVRNLAAGSLAKRFGIAEGSPLRHPLVEFYYKNDALGDPLATDAEISALGLAPDVQLSEIRALALRINEVLKDYLVQRNVQLVDFKVEFGVDRTGKLLLADEISPDTCRLWDAASGEKLDKDRFRRDLGGVEEAYAEILRRVLGGPKNDK